jgi:Farnesoic acid 0-methyl transferase
VAQADTPNILNCSSDRYFWISWTNTEGSEISVGRNTQVNKGTIATWVDISPKVVTGVCVATSNDNIGSWSVNTLPGN